MLSRYRSVSCLHLPRGSRAARTNNPVQQFEETTAFRLDRLREHGGTLLASANLSPQDSLRTALRLWDGPLAGIAHLAGQFPALQEGPSAQEGPQPPEELARALAADLDFLVGLAELTQDIVYDAGGSESDFAVVPFILEPRSATAAAAAVTGDLRQLAPQGQPPEPAQLSVATTFTEGTANADLKAAGGCDEGPMGRWWSVSEAVALPLSPAEVAASLEVAPALVGRLQPPLEFATGDAFWSHMLCRHIERLDGGEQFAGQTLQQPQPQQPPQQPQLPQPHDRQQPHHQPPQHPPAPFEVPQFPSGATAATSSAAAMAAAVRALARAVQFPAAVQLTLGSEDLGWNPIPLMWLGRSRRSGAILGLLTAVVWT